MVGVTASTTRNRAGEAAGSDFEGASLPEPQAVSMPITATNISLRLIIMAGTVAAEPPARP